MSFPAQLLRRTSALHQIPCVVYVPCNISSQGIVCVIYCHKSNNQYNINTRECCIKFSIQFSCNNQLMTCPNISSKNVVCQHNGKSQSSLAFHLNFLFCFGFLGVTILQILRCKIVRFVHNNLSCLRLLFGTFSSLILKNLDLFQIIFQVTLFFNNFLHYIRPLFITQAVQLAGEHCALEYVALDTLEYVFRIIFYVVFLHTLKVSSLTSIF